MKTPSLCLLIGIWLCCALPAWAELPTVEVVIDTATVTVGDPIRLTLRLRYRADVRASLPDLSTWLQGFSVRPGDGQPPIEVEDGLELIRRFELRLYELGSKQIPSLAVDFVRASGDTLVRASQPLDVEVVSTRCWRQMTREVKKDKQIHIESSTSPTRVHVPAAWATLVGGVDIFFSNLVFVLGPDLVGFGYGRALRLRTYECGTQKEEH